MKMPLLVLLLACGSVQAAEWVSVGKAADIKATNFVDVSSIRVAGEIRRAWVKTVFAPNAQRGRGSNADRWLSDELSRYAFNCGEETFREEAEIQYFSDGTFWSEPASDYPEPWQPQSRPKPLGLRRCSSSARGSRNEKANPGGAVLRQGIGGNYED